MPHCIRLLLLVLFPICMKAQVPGWNSFRLQEDNKIFKINTLLKGKDGYIYAGTTNGLYKFDGINFLTVSFSKAAVHDTITALFEDNAGLMWAGFKNGKLAKKINGQLAYINPEEGTPQVAITCFLQDQQNNIWFGTNGEGLYRFQNNHLYLIDEADGLSDKHIHGLATTSDGKVLAITDQGINICSLKGQKTNIEIIGPKNGLPDYYVTSISSAGDDTFWIGMQEKGICLFNYKQHTIIVPAVCNVNWNYGQVNAIISSSKNIWIATEEAGMLVKPLHDSASVFQHGANYKGSITNLLQDNEGNLWMNSSTELIRTNGDKIQLLPLYDKQLFETIHTIYPDRYNNIWAGTDGGIIRFSFNNGIVASKKFPLAGFTAQTDITSLYQDQFDHIWIGSMGNGIVLFDPNSGKYRSINENNLLTKASILSISGAGSTVCAGGLEGAAVIFHLSDTNRNINAPIAFSNYNNITNIGNNYIYCILKDSKDRIWFGTDGKGVTVLENGHFITYAAKDGLKDEHITAITEDKHQQIWFATEDEGLYCFDGHQFKNYSISNGLSSLKINALKTDHFGNIVILHENGFDILNPLTGTVSYINAVQGVTEVSTDAGNLAQQKDGGILLATGKGIVLYNTDAHYQTQPTTLIDHIRLFLTDIDPSTPGQFSYDENSFTFLFTGLYYSNPQQVRYQYKLEGWDSSWISTKDRSITFPRLQPGKYTFHIRSSLNDNFENAHEATYSFIIKSPIWKRNWFIVLCILLTAGLFYAYIKWRENNIRKIQLLEQEKIQFQFQVLRNQVNPHFLFNSFNTLISTIEENPSRAVEYVEQLSDFFRNIVNYRDKDVISLQEEIGLLNTYYFLQQKRYGEHLQLAIDISDSLQQTTFIPPLTLQLLMENAIKHNAVSKESNLTVTLAIVNDRLIVKNNINPIFNKKAGAGMGLQNIISRYKLLSEIAVTVSNDGKEFAVTLPVLKS